MPWKESIEFDVYNALEVLPKIRKYKGVLRANMINATRISVWFDNRQIIAKRIVKAGRKNRHTNHDTIDHFRASFPV